MKFIISSLYCRMAINPRSSNNLIIKVEDFPKFETHYIILSIVQLNELYELIL